MILRCTLDGLLLAAHFNPDGTLSVYDGDDAFVLEAVEAAYYELVTATADELVALQRARLRLLRRAADFVCLAG